MATAVLNLSELKNELPVDVDAESSL